MTVVITYKPHPNVRRFSDEKQVLGGYYVRYEEDDFTAFIPHVGWLGTVSAEPLDPDEPEHRDVILAEAGRMKAMFDERAAT